MRLFRSVPYMLAVATASLGVFLVAPAAQVAVSAHHTSPTYAAGAVRGNGGPVISKTYYDYAPSAMLDGVYKVWWCGGIAGDHIFYSQASSLSGPWSSPSIVMYPSGGSNFDGAHACDPSVIRVNGIYYMYYGGNTDPGTITKVGLATSVDGINWVRANGGNAIIGPAMVQTVEMYGAGQPSAIYLEGLFYLLYTDTTGAASNPINGGGVYVVRSADPTFQSGVEVLAKPTPTSAPTFVPRTTANATSYRFMDAVSVDWMYSDAVDKFVVGINVGDPNGYFFFKSRPLTAEPSADAYQTTLPGATIDGFGLVRRPDGHARASTTCSTIPLDVMRGIGDPGNHNTWELGWVGRDVTTSLTCYDAHVDKTLESYIMSSPSLPWALVVNGTRLQFAASAPALKLSKNVIAVSSDVYHLVPYGGSLYWGAAVYYTAGQPHAFEMDGYPLWPVGCADVIYANGSPVYYLDPALYAARPKGPPLYCVQ